MTLPPLYRAKPTGEVIGTILVVHEIFGLTPHIRSVCDRLAAEGYEAVAPDLFAGELHGACLPYTDEGKTEGLRIRDVLTEPQLLAVLDATLAALTPGLPRIVLGFCLGGTLAYLMAAETKIEGAIGYYAVGLRKYLGRPPLCPTLLHFGLHDQSIPKSDVDAVSAACATIDIHCYDAGHAFNRDDDKAYVPAAAAVAWERTLAFLQSRALHADVVR